MIDQAPEMIVRTYCKNKTFISRLIATPYIMDCDHDCFRPVTYTYRSLFFLSFFLCVCLGFEGSSLQLPNRTRAEAPPARFWRG